MEFLNEVERGWLVFSSKWRAAVAAGKVSRELLEAQRGWYYAATRHAIVMVANAGYQEMLKDPEQGAAHLAARLRRMLAAIDVQAAIAHARRPSRLKLATSTRKRQGATLAHKKRGN